MRPINSQRRWTNSQATSSWSWSPSECHRGHRRCGGSSCGGRITWAIPTATLRARLSAVYAAVHTAAPHARLLVLGYPRLFTPTPVATAPCPVAAVDAKALSKAENSLNASIAAAVARANKVAGIRAAPCGDAFAARMSREHNDANVLAMGARVTQRDTAIEILRIWLETAFAGGRHTRRVEKIADLERRTRPAWSAGEPA